MSQIILVLVLLSSASFCAGEESQLAQYAVMVDQGPVKRSKINVESKELGSSITFNVKVSAIEKEIRYAPKLDLLCPCMTIKNKEDNTEITFDLTHFTDEKIVKYLVFDQVKNGKIGERADSFILIINLKVPQFIDVSKIKFDDKEIIFPLSAMLSDEMQNVKFYDNDENELNPREAQLSLPSVKRNAFAFIQVKNKNSQILRKYIVKRDQ